MGFWSSITKGIKNIGKTVVNSFSSTSGLVTGGLGKGYLDKLGDTISGGLSDAWGDYTGKTIAEKNLDFQREQLDYQKMLNEQQMQREDTAYQRKVADMTKAGFNPILATGGSGSPSAPLHAGPAPQLGDYSGGMREGLGVMSDLVMKALTMRKDFAMKDAEIRKMNAEKDYYDTLKDKVSAETTGLNIDNETKGRMNDLRIQALDLDNQLKSGTLQNNILMSYKKLRQVDLDYENSKLDGMLKKLNIEHEDVIILQDKLRNKLYVQDYEKGQLELTAKTIAILKAAAEYNTYIWDVSFYHDRYNLPYGFNLNQGVLGSTIPQIAAQGEKVWAKVKDFFVGDGDGYNINNLIRNVMDYCNSTVDGLTEIAKKIGITKNQLINLFRRGK